MGTSPTRRQRVSRKLSNLSGGRYRLTRAGRECRPRERSLLHREIGMQVDLRRLDRFMSEPQRDHGAVDAGCSSRIAAAWRRTCIVTCLVASEGHITVAAVTCLASRCSSPSRLTGLPVGGRGTAVRIHRRRVR